MKAPIVRLYAAVILLFAILIGFTSRWSVFEAQGLVRTSSAPGALGDIVARDRTRWAEVVKSRGIQPE